VSAPARGTPGSRAADADNTDAGFRADATANGSTFSGFAFFGNYTIRIDGPGKVFDFANVSNITIDNIWVEHTVCLYWGANTDNMTIKNSRIRDTFADGINMTNGSTGNLVDNNEPGPPATTASRCSRRSTRAAATRSTTSTRTCPSTLTWRAAGIAVYGGYATRSEHLHRGHPGLLGHHDQLAGLRLPDERLRRQPADVFENISIVRAGGHFWGAQTFPAIWMFSASKVFQGIRVSNVDIVDPTYSGIMFQTNYVGGQPQNPITDTSSPTSRSPARSKSGDAYDAKSGFGIWANPLPEAGSGPGGRLGHLQRGGEEGRRQRGDGQPGAQRQARRLRGDPRVRADRARRARLRAAHQAARRARPAGRPGPARAAEPDLPGAGRGGRPGRWRSAASPRCCAPARSAACPRRDYVEMLLDQQVSGVVFAGGSYAQADAEHEPLPALPTAAAGRAGQRRRRRPGLPAHLHRRRGGGRAGVRAPASRSARADRHGAGPGGPHAVRRKLAAARGAAAAGRASRVARRADELLDGERPAGRGPADRARRHRHDLRQRRARARLDPGRPPARPGGAARTSRWSATTTRR
jgi:hypothetical protein